MPFVFISEPKTIGPEFKIAIKSENIMIKAIAEENIIALCS
jgi:hypothetical protein